MLANFNSLPQEVVDAILVFLHDRTTLKACSLTCHSMVQGAQRGLFSALSVGPALLESERQTSICSTDLFLKMITEIPHVTSYVISLRLNCSFNRTKRHYRRLEKALLSFSHITKFAFYLSEDNPEKFLESGLSNLFQTSLTLPTLRHVELLNVPIELFPYDTPVKHLVIRFDYPMPEFAQTITHPQSRGRRPTILESLDIDDSDPEAIGFELVINRFLECQGLDISRLTRLHISLQNMEPQGEHDIYVAQLLELCGDSLQILKFTPSRYSTLMVIKHSNAIRHFFIARKRTG